MRPISFTSPAVYILMLLLWMYVREWPWGDPSQIVMDIVMIVIGYIVWKKNRSENKPS